MFETYQGVIKRNLEHLSKFHTLYIKDIFEYLVGIRENNVGREYFTFLIKKKI